MGWIKHKNTIDLSWTIERIVVKYSMSSIWDVVCLVSYFVLAVQLWPVVLEWSGVEWGRVGWEN